MSLQISKTLALPGDAVTQTFAILARKSAGKSYCAGVMAEEMNKSGLPFIWVDPVGASFGFRSSADGKHPGLPIVILGGDHGDIGLTPETGEQVAKFIVSENVSVLLDLSLMRKAEQVRFMTGFSEAIYHLNKHPRHLFVDETDLFAPQRPFPEGMRLLGAVEDIVRRGRIKGLGFTSITQRAAVLNKDILTQTECLIVLQTTGPQDKKAVKEWVDVHVDDPNSSQVREFERSLPTLQKGQAWIWSPAWLKTFQLVQIRKKETFDSSATPKPGQLSKPKVVAEVDLSTLQVQMASVIAEQKANDPKELRRQIAELKRELATPKIPATPVIDVDAIVAEEVRKALAEQATSYEQKLSTLVEAIGAITKEHLSANGFSRFTQEYKPAPVRIAPRVRAATSVPVAPARPTAAAAAASFEGPPLTKCARSLLSVIARYPDGVSRPKLSHLSGYSKGSSTFANGLTELRKGGYAVDGAAGDIKITDAGISAVGDYYEPLPETPADLHKYWMQRLDAAERALFGALLQQYPNSMTYDELANATGYSAISSTFANALTTLRKLGLASGSKAVGMVASETLF